MDRRQFLLNTVAGVGGTLLLPVAGLATSGTATYGRITLRSHGDFAAFAMLRGGQVVGPVDLFAVTPAPPGDERDSALTPLGRMPDLATARATLTAMDRPLA